MSESDQKSRTADMSARGLVWIEPQQDEQKVQAFARQTGHDEVLSAFLVEMGVEPEQVDDFLHPTLRSFCPDPSSFADMDKATEEIAKSILERRKVTVFADYDVDGATSAAQLTRYFRHFGLELGLYVPDRLAEGYGPSPAAFQVLKDRGMDLVITVDCGAAAEKALAHARGIDLPIIVLDHHLMKAEIPHCLALVNPNRPDCTSEQGHLAAAGVVFMLLISLNRYFRTVKGYRADQLPDLKQYLDLCCLGTLCDMAPLKGVNRAFVVQGLKQVEAECSAGLFALSQVSGRSSPKSVTDMTFGIGPQLNAGGRIGDPWLASNLLSTDDMNEAMPLAEQLHILNNARKDVENEILTLARRQLEISLEENPSQNVLIATGEGWHPGVIGIVAGRLKDEFHRPVVVIGHGDEFGDLAKGSARSVTGMNIGEALSRAVDAGLLVSGGGHAMAGGLSMQVCDFDALRTFLNHALSDKESELETAREVEISLDVLASSVNLKLLSFVEMAGPYGAAAPKPLFRIKNVRVEFSRIIGENHKKLTFSDGSGRIDAVAWRVVDRPLGDILQKDRNLDIIGYIERNSWQGREAVQFEIFDAKENK